MPPPSSDPPPPGLGEPEPLPDEGFVPDDALGVEPEPEAGEVPLPPPEPEV